MKGQLTIIEGNSGSGKSSLIAATYPKAVSLMITKQTLPDYLLKKEWIDSGIQNVIFEDVDLLKGCIATQQSMCRFVEGLLESRNVVISGTNLERRVPFIASLKHAENARVIALPPRKVKPMESRQDPADVLLPQLASAFEVSPEFLAGHAETFHKLTSLYSYDLTHEEARLIDTYRLLPFEIRSKFIDLVSGYFKK